MESGFSYREADRWLGARGSLQRTCPACSHLRKAHHRKLPCLGLKRTGADRIVYSCQNCGVEGVVTEGWGEARPTPRNRTETVGTDDEGERLKREAWALDIWTSSGNPAGTLAETYWRARGLEPPLPASMRFHPGLKHDDGISPALIVAAGLDGDEIRGIQRIFLAPDGSGHLGKRSLGTIKGSPMVVHTNLESVALVIGEGCEKVASLAQPMNIDGWASGGLSFLPHLAARVPDYVEVVTIIVDPGPMAQQVCDELADALVERGVEALFTRAWR